MHKLNLIVFALSLTLLFSCKTETNNPTSTPGVDQDITDESAKGDKPEKPRGKKPKGKKRPIGNNDNQIEEQEEGELEEAEVEEEEEVAAVFAEGLEEINPVLEIVSNTHQVFFDSLPSGVRLNEFRGNGLVELTINCTGGVACTNIAFASNYSQNDQFSGWRPPHFSDDGNALSDYTTVINGEHVTVEFEDLGHYYLTYQAQSENNEKSSFGYLHLEITDEDLEGGGADEDNDEDACNPPVFNINRHINPAVIGSCLEPTANIFGLSGVLSLIDQTAHLAYSTGALGLGVLRYYRIDPKNSLAGVSVDLTEPPFLSNQGFVLNYYQHETLIDEFGENISGIASKTGIHLESELPQICYSDDTGLKIASKLSIGNTFLWSIDSVTEDFGDYCHFANLFGQDVVFYLKSNSKIYYSTKNADGVWIESSPFDEEDGIEAFDLDYIVNDNFIIAFTVGNGLKLAKYDGANWEILNTNPPLGGWAFNPSVAVGGNSVLIGYDKGRVQGAVHVDNSLPLLNDIKFYYIRPSFPNNPSSAFNFFDDVSYSHYDIQQGVQTGTNNGSVFLDSDNNQYFIFRNHFTHGITRTVTKGLKFGKGFSYRRINNEDNMSGGTNNNDTDGRPLIYNDTDILSDDNDNLFLIAHRRKDNQSNVCYFLQDEDRDGLSDIFESQIETGTDPSNRDTDDDGLTDKLELLMGLDPSNSDSDDDGTGDLEAAQACNVPYPIRN